MRLLLLGGMRFLGRAVVDAALAQGHDATIFNRGRSDPPPARVRRVIGDREGGLGALDGLEVDAVIDTSGYVPRLVRAAAERFAGSGAHYVFVSSISVYADVTPGQDESAPVHVLEDPATEEVTGATYGGLKALCERAAETALPGRVANVRAGLIVGPHDYTDRFPYWVRHMAGAAETLAPGTGEGPVQLIDVRDLAEWILRLAERRIAGTFNGTGPERPWTFRALLEAMRTALGGTAPLTWIDEPFLLEQGVVPFNELPLWVPAESAGFLRCDVRRAVDSGLTFRSIADTARDTKTWLDALAPAAPRRSDSLVGATLSREREEAILDAWHRTSRSPS